MNYGGQVVGTSYRPGNALQDAFHNSPGGGMVDLNTLVDPQLRLQLTYANALNDAGQITGGGQHAFLLTPTPEPGVLPLIGLAALPPSMWRLKPGSISRTAAWSRRSEWLCSW
jgi:probable HAF family extracellular repeat protein